MRVLPPRCGHFFLVVSLASCAMAARSASAQTVTGTVVQDGTGTALEGALVQLLDEKGEQRASVLSNRAGMFVLRPPTPGRYMVTADFIGYQQVSEGPLDVEQASVSIVLSMAVDPVALRDVVVTARSRCRIRPESGPETHKLWTEARKVLDVVNRSVAQGLYGFELVTYRRMLDRTGRPTRQVRTDSTFSYGRRPFVTLSVDEFGRDGLIVRAPREAFTFYAPDADILLSEEFLATHCFWVTRRSGGNDGLVGLAFEPAGTAGRSGISGVLWLDQESSDLKSLEYSYTVLPWGLLSGTAGGRISFGRTPDGGWMMERWSIQIPRVQHAQVLRRGSQYVLVGYEEASGEVLSVNLPERRRRLPIAVRDAPVPVPTDTSPAEVESTLRVPPQPMDTINASTSTDTTTHPPTPILLDPVRAEAEIRFTGRLGEVRDRQLRYEKLGQGHFIWRDDFKHRSPNRLTDVLREIPGVEIVPVGSMARYPGQFVVRMSRNQSLRNRGCHVQLYVDGHRLPMDGEIFDLIAPPIASIEAIEVYTGASQVPSELGGSNFGCGVIAVWTSMSIR